MASLLFSVVPSSAEVELDGQTLSFQVFFGVSGHFTLCLLYQPVAPYFSMSGVPWSFHWVNQQRHPEKGFLD